MADPRKKILITLSTDFGELANALYLLDGTNADAHLLLPPRLYEKNHAAIPQPNSLYKTIDDLLAAIKIHQPKLLLLFSAYLFGINQICTPAELQLLIDQARALGTIVATTDPFLGVISHLTPTTFVHPMKAVLSAHFAELQPILAALPQIYLSPPPRDAEKNAASFYNPRIILTADSRAAFHATLNSANIKTATPYWLFVLSAEDYVSQCSILGRPAFDAALLRLLSQTQSAGRHPIMLAPQVALETLAPRAPAGATLMNFCDYKLFRALTLSAQHAFYWNIFSNSILPRVANGGPVFFFDPGHMARSIPSILPLGNQSYYANAPLPMLDINATLSSDDLANLAASQSKNFASALANFRKLPSPDQMLASLIGAA